MDLEGRKLNSVLGREEVRPLFTEENYYSFHWLDSKRYQALNCGCYFFHFKIYSTIVPIYCQSWLLGDNATNMIMPTSPTAHFTLYI